jgi:hypothetical protein
MFVAIMSLTLSAALVSVVVQNVVAPIFDVCVIPRHLISSV